MLSLRLNDLKFLFSVAGASDSCVIGNKVAYNVLNSLQKILETVLSATNCANRHLELSFSAPIMLVTILLLNSVRDFS